MKTTITILLTLTTLATAHAGGDFNVFTNDGRINWSTNTCTPPKDDENYVYCSHHPIRKETINRLKCRDESCETLIDPKTKDKYIFMRWQGIAWKNMNEQLYLHIHLDEFEQVREKRKKQ